MAASPATKSGIVGTLGRFAISVVGALMVVGLAPYFLLTRPDGGVTQALAAAGIGFAAFLMGRIHDVAELSLWPLRAKMRESIAQANATIAELRQVALALGRTGLATLGADQFMDGMNQSTRFAMHDQIVNALLSTGATSNEMSKATTEWRQCLAIRYHRIIVDTALPQPRDAKEQTARNKLESLVDFSKWEAASPERYREVLAEFDLLKPEIKEWISDYEHLLKTGTLTRREEFIHSK